MKKIFITSLITGFLICMVLLLSTCKQTTQPEEKDETGLVVPGAGIIVPGISVEGIKLGDTKDTVEAKLGKPTSVGWADGLSRGWRLYCYSEGDSRDPNDVKLEFYFIDNGDDYGPVDDISIGPKYKGKTKEGIGIGTALEQVHQAYGLPAESFLSERNIVEKYCLNGRKLEIHYNNKDSLITVMSTGYFVPMQEDNPCK